MNSHVELLTQFLLTQASKVSSMNPSEMTALLMYYSKANLIATNAMVEDDDWDTISFAILLKQLMKSNEDAGAGEDVSI